MILTILIIIFFAIACSIVKSLTNKYNRETEEELKELEIIKELMKKYDDER